MCSVGLITRMPASALPLQGGGMHSCVPACPMPAMIEALRAAFAAHANPARAAAMQAYMKSALPCCGIAAPLRRKLVVAAATAHPAPDTAALAATMLTLWREARCLMLLHTAQVFWHHCLPLGLMRGEQATHGIPMTSVLAAKGQFLRNPADPGHRNAPDLRQPNDELVLKFVKP